VVARLRKVAHEAKDCDPQGKCSLDNILC
jgi:hypothetical protein